jgi:hypothetical protein
LQRKLIRRLIISAAIASPFAGAAVNAPANAERGTQLCAQVGVGDTPKDQPPTPVGPCVTPPPETGPWVVYCGGGDAYNEVGPDHTVHVSNRYCYGYPV